MPGLLTQMLLFESFSPFLIGFIEHTEAKANFATSFSTFAPRTRTPRASWRRPRQRFARDTWRGGLS